MRALITGGNGFAMSVIAEHLATTHTVTDLVLHDLAPVHPSRITALRRHGVSVESCAADIRDAGSLESLLRRHSFDVVIHAAAITHVPAWELSRATDYIDVNVSGTIKLLEALRNADRGLRRFVLVSSCAVYGAGRADLDPQPECGPIVPDDIYGISKMTAEAVLHRYATLFGIPYVIARPGKLFGPMERPTDTRSLMSAPYHVADAWRRGRTLRVSQRTLEAALDWLSVQDAARAFAGLVAGLGPDRAIYNLGTGRRVPFTELVAAAEGIAGRTLTTVASAGVIPELDLNPDDKFGKDAASDIRKAECALGWAPRPFNEQVTSYFDWLDRRAAGMTT